MNILYIIAILVIYYIFKNKNILNNIKNKANNSTHYSQRDTKKTQNKTYTMKTNYGDTVSDNVEKFLYEKLALMKTDFIQNPFSDKFSISENIRKFTFESGEILQMRIENNTYTIEFITYNKQTKKKNGKHAKLSFGFANVFNDFFTQTLKSSTTRGSSHSDIHMKTKSKKSKLYSDKQLDEQDKYYKLLDVYETRKNHLNQLDSNDPNKISLENELSVVERKLLKIKPRTGL